MNGSRNSGSHLSDADSAAQQSREAARAPRPLPLFLELVRIASQADPALASRALEGLTRYERAPSGHARPKRPVIARIGGAALRDCGGSGPPAVLVPSLINPPEILDLDDAVSLAEAVARMGRRALLIDWGPASERSSFDVGGHVEQLLAPLLRQLDETPALIGYCLGGTMAIAAANVGPIQRIVTLAAPWRFSAYPDSARASLARLWESAKPAAEALGALPMEVLQAAFWSLDPLRTVSKFADFASEDPKTPKARRFVTLEEWANRGEPLPCPAARELIEDLFGRVAPERGEWRVGGEAVTDRLECPLLNITAAHDRITPAAAAAASGDTVQVEAGHVGMIVGSKRAQLHTLLNDFLAAGPSRR